MFEGSTIIYCPSRKKTENVAAALQGKWKKLHVMYIEGTIESKFVDWMEKWISIWQLVPLLSRVFSSPGTLAVLAAILLLMNVSGWISNELEIAARVASVNER
jgi:hypothetical protein